jgi:hypothetical protein
MEHPIDHSDQEVLKDLQFQIAKLELGPGDILLVKDTNPDTTQKRLFDLSRVMRHLVPSNVRVCIVDKWLEFTVISQGEAEELVARRKPPERIIPADLP